MIKTSLNILTEAKIDLINYFNVYNFPIVFKGLNILNIFNEDKFITSNI